MLGYWQQLGVALGRLVVETVVDISIEKADHSGRSV
jgi:hypothetical protein